MYLQNGVDMWDRLYIEVGLDENGDMSMSDDGWMQIVWMDG